MIDFGRKNKGKRVAIVEGKAGDTKEVKISGGYYPLAEKGFIVFSEYDGRGEDIIRLGNVLQENAVLIWFNSIEAIEKVEKHLKRIKRNLR